MDHFSSGQKVNETGSAEAYWSRQIPQEHAHTTGLTTGVIISPSLLSQWKDVLGRCREICVVEARRILDRDRHAVIALAALSKVVVLEAIRCVSTPSQRASKRIRDRT